MPSIEPSAPPVGKVISNIEDGDYRIPKFQRDYVWSVEDASALIDSIIKGYPIGSVILWETTEKLRDVRSIGSINFPEYKDGDKINYVLDGQQRLTSLFAALKAQKITVNNSEYDFSSIVVDLSPDNEEDARCLPKIPNEKQDDDKRYIPLSVLYAGGRKDLRDYPVEYDSAIDDSQTALRTYQVGTIKMVDADISVATEVFTRLNTGGKSLNVFEIMVAKSYDVKSDFDLLDRWTEFRKKLKKSDYDDFNPVTMLQLAALISGKDCTNRGILKLSRPDFIDGWKKAEKAMAKAVDYLKNSFSLPTGRLLPYPGLAVAVGFFLHEIGDKKPNTEQKNLIRDFFWRTSFSEHYSSSSDTKLNTDRPRFLQMTKGNRPKYESDRERDDSWLSEDWMLEYTFGAGLAYSRAIMCVLASCKPKSFDDDSDVNLQSNYMLQANSKNFHHIFPKSYLEKNGVDYVKANSPVNISLVDDYLNKRKIKARPPSDYMAQFKTENDNFVSSMRSHLIPVGDKSPIWSDDYDEFLIMRASLIVKKVRGWLVESE